MPATSLLERIAALAPVYDALQHLFGLPQTRRRLAPHVFPAGCRRVLDVGGGTGLYRTLIPHGANYCLVDIDAQKLGGYKTKFPGSPAVQGDATALCLANEGVDVALCIAVSHHLTDEQLMCLVRELNRVVTRRLVFLDAVLQPDSAVSRWLWRYDRGSYPRSAAALSTALAAHFECEHVEHYTIYHRYLLWIGRPRPGTRTRS